MITAKFLYIVHTREMSIFTNFVTCKTFKMSKMNLILKSIDHFLII